MSSEKFIEGLRIFSESQAKSRRTCVPGQVGNITKETDRDQDADFVPGIPDLVAGEADSGTPSPDAPRLNIAGGGFYILLPVAKGDEAVGLVSDRALDEWRQSRTPGLPPVFERIQDDSDVMIAPLAITAPSGAPSSWDGLTLGGPAGPCIDLDDVGALTITKQGTPVATITLDASGSVTIDVEVGQSVNIGDGAAAALAKAQDLLTAIDSAITAAITAAAPIVPPNGDGGTAAFGAFQTAWNLVKNNIATLKAKGS
jgi:hypothetical protein